MFDDREELPTLLIHLVGAGRFERPTSCAQGGFQLRHEVVCFQHVLFQGDGAILLCSVEVC
jgi:hypothetical protein